MKGKVRISHTQIENFFKMLNAKGVTGQELSDLLGQYNLSTKVSDLDYEDFEMVRDTYRKPPIQVGSVLHTSEEYLKVMSDSTLRIGTALGVSDNPYYSGNLIVLKGNDGEHRISEYWLIEGSPLVKAYGHSYHNNDRMHNAQRRN